MPSLNMKGPYEIWTEENGKKVKNTGNVVPKNVKIGNYAFGNQKEDGFHVFYVGRSDDRKETGLLDEINQQIDNGKAKDCAHFKYSVANSHTEAYEKECQNYHDFRPSRNEVHPARPADNGHYKCPVASCPYHE